MVGQVINTEKYPYRRRLRVRGPDGKVIYSAGANDAVSRAMWQMSKSDLITVANDNNLGPRFRKHSQKNTGHFKMILGQALRDRVKKGQVVQIGQHAIERLDQPVALPKGYIEVPVSMVPPSVRITVRENRR